MSEPKSRSTLGFWIVILLLGVGFTISMMVNAGLAAALAAKFSKPSSSGDEAVDEFPDMTEVWSYGDGDVKAVRIPVTGVIMRGAEETLFSTPVDRIESILAQIRAAANDESVRAIIVEIDSPGGAITPSDEIYRALNDFRTSSEDRVVVAYVRDLAASGGYYVAMASDWVIAEPTAIVGSIGVLMQTLNWKALSDRIGIRDTTIKSGANKDMLNPFQETPPEQIALLQKMVDTMYERFLGIVRDSRELPDETIRPLADGRIFSADEALAEKLIDEVGGWSDVRARAAGLLEVENLRIVRYEQAVDVWTWLMHARLNLNPSVWLNHDSPRLLYLWRP